MSYLICYLEYIEKCYKPNLWVGKRLPSVKVCGYPNCTLEPYYIGQKRLSDQEEDEIPVFMDSFLV